MPAKKRTSAKPRVVTDATKAKLPKPKRKPKPKVDQMGELDPRLTAATRVYREKMHRRREILQALGAQEMPSFTPNTPRAIPCGEDVTPLAQSLDPEAKKVLYDNLWNLYDNPPKPIRVPPPDTSAYPWPLKAAWWLDGWLARIAKRFA